MVKLLPASPKNRVAAGDSRVGTGDTAAHVTRSRLEAEKDGVAGVSGGGVEADERDPSPLLRVERDAVALVQHNVPTRRQFLYRPAYW